MKNQVQEKMYEEKRNEEGAREKRLYHTPTLTKLGNVKKLTLGLPPSVAPDVGGVSF